MPGALLSAFGLSCLSPVFSLPSPIWPVVGHPSGSNRLAGRASCEPDLASEVAQFPLCGAHSEGMAVIQLFCYHFISACAAAKGTVSICPASSLCAALYPFI